MNYATFQLQKITYNNKQNILKMTSSCTMMTFEQICMLLQGFTGFDDVITACVTSQLQNVYFKQFNKK